MFQIHLPNHTKLSVLLLPFIIIFEILAFHKKKKFISLFYIPCSFNVQHSFAHSHITLGNFYQLKALHSSGSEVAALPLDCVHVLSLKTRHKSPMANSIFMKIAAFNIESLRLSFVTLLTGNKSFDCLFVQAYLLHCLVEMCFVSAFSVSILKIPSL